MLSETETQRHVDSSLYSLYLICPQLTNGSNCLRRLLTSSLISSTEKLSFLECSSFKLLWNTNRSINCLQIPLWLDFGLVLLSSWFSCFLCWLCWPRQELHTKSKFEPFLNVTKPQGELNKQTWYRGRGEKRGLVMDMLPGPSCLWVGPDFLLTFCLLPLGFSGGPLWI